ncbi:HtaA domain-containing protein [Leucobacter sp. HY1908]
MPSTPRPRLTPAARLMTGLGAGALAAVALVGPAYAAPVQLAPAMPLQTNDVAACNVTEASFTWGVKESFRSYISGSIANGEWTVSDDMRYETPSFIWDKAQGSLAPELDAGEIGFTGAVHFTGHDGAMTLDLADPKVEFESDETAYLVLTIGSSDTTSGGESVAQTPVRAAKLDLEGAVTAGGQDLEIDGVVPRLTAEGAAALNGAYGSYVAGEELDPVMLKATVAGCELGALTATDQPVQQEPDDGLMPLDSETDTTAGAEIPWLPIGIGAVALLVIGVTGGMLLGGKRKGKN